MTKEAWTRRTFAGLGAFLALLALVLMPRVIAGDTAQVNVLANVLGTCKFVSGATLNFGNLDPSVGTDANATTSLQFWCTRGASYTITDNNGQNSSGTTQRMKHATVATELIPYSYCYTSSGPAPTPCTTDTTSVTGTGSGPQNPITLNISGTITGSNYTNALVGSYSDTVNMNITP
ncbi:MAG: spore coat U domain-containing protein [Acidobacteria bacterium]|nr:spore coat U domain-containing protein [Acidobacteriota bacterium]MDW7983410.1 spore coat protein U domain-containing protein [Acidobacteriota bacterium]